MRIRGSRGAAALVAAGLLVTGVGVQAEEPEAPYPAPPTPGDYRRPMGKLVPPEGALFGTHVEGADVATEQNSIEELEAQIGRKFDINNYYYPFDDTFPTWREQYDFANGRYPLISWGCVDVDEILRGQHDALIDTRGRALAALEKPLFLRWCWEMDGDRPEKSKKVKSPEKFIAAWQYLWQRVYDAGGTNVVRVWCPNAMGFKTGAAQPFYPGDEWVDWVCTDGYNWAPGRRGDDWRSFVKIFDESYRFAVSRYKPLMIGEWGAQERDPGEKAAWIREAHLAMKTRMPAIAAVLSFAVVHLYDWRVTTAPDSLEAYREAAFDPYYNPPDPAFVEGPGESTAPGPLGPPGKPGVGDDPVDADGDGYADGDLYGETGDSGSPGGAGDSPGESGDAGDSTDEGGAPGGGGDARAGGGSAPPEDSRPPAADQAR